MPKVPKSNIPPADLRALIEKSGLSITAFAELMGTPAATLQQQLRGRCPIRGATLNAARFTLLRLGHSVTIEPVPAGLLRNPRGRHERAR